MKDTVFANANISKRNKRLLDNMADKGLLMRKPVEYRRIQINVKKYRCYAES
jgi:hypothetical protein